MYLRRRNPACSKYLRVKCLIVTHKRGIPHVYVFYIIMIWNCLSSIWKCLSTILISRNHGNSIQTCACNSLKLLTIVSIYIIGVSGMLLSTPTYRNQAFFGWVDFTVEKHTSTCHFSQKAFFWMEFWVRRLHISQAIQILFGAYFFFFAD